MLKQRQLVYFRSPEEEYIYLHIVEQITLGSKPKVLKIVKVVPDMFANHLASLCKKYRIPKNCVVELDEIPESMQ